MFWKLFNEIFPRALEGRLFTSTDMAKPYIHRKIRKLSPRRVTGEKIKTPKD